MAPNDIPPQDSSDSFISVPSRGVVPPIGWFTSDQELLNDYHAHGFCGMSPAHRQPFPRAYCASDASQSSLGFTILACAAVYILSGTLALTILWCTNRHIRSLDDWLAIHLGSGRWARTLLFLLRFAMFLVWPVLCFAALLCAAHGRGGVFVVLRDWGVSLQNLWNRTMTDLITIGEDRRRKKPMASPVDHERRRIEEDDFLAIELETPQEHGTRLEQNPWHPLDERKYKNKYPTLSQAMF